MQHSLTVLGWPCTVTAGEKIWVNADHTPAKKTGTLWYRKDKVTVNLPADMGGPRELTGYLQVKEQKTGGRLKTVTTAHYNDTGVADGEFGLVSLIKWLLEQEDIGPKTMAKNGAKK